MFLGLSNSPFLKSQPGQSMKANPEMSERPHVQGETESFIIQSDSWQASTFLFRSSFLRYLFADRSYHSLQALSFSLS